MAITFDSVWPVLEFASAASSATAAHSPNASTKLIAVLIVTGGGSVTSVTDNLGNTYTVLAPFTTPAAEKVYLAYSIPSSIGSITITGHYSPNTRSTIGAAAFLGTAASGSLDKTPAGASGTGTALTGTATGTLSFANEVIIAYGANDNAGAGNTWTPGGSFLNATNNTNGSTAPTGFLFYQIVASTATITPTATNAVSAGWGIGSATFADTPVGGTAYSLTCAAGVYAYTGEPAQLVWGPTTYTLMAAPGNYDYVGGQSGADYSLSGARGVYAYLGGLTNLIWSGAPVSSGPVPSSLKQWIPFQMACRLRCLRQGTLNVGNTAQNVANLLTLALIQIATPSNPAWAKLSGAVNQPKKILIRPAYVPGFVGPPAP